MSEHTPGPWTAKRIPDGFVIKQTGGHGKYLFNLEECPGIPETEANARLIAAAPDLLAALRHSVRMMEGMDDPHFVDVLKAARAAIAKAEGWS